MFLLTALLAASVDIKFHSWCSELGIKTPLAKLETTSRSVAGRGVFATDDIAEGDSVILIPEGAVLHQYNAALYFPRVAKQLEKKKRRFQNRTKWWRRFRQQIDEDDLEFVGPSDFWQAELTAFTLASLESDHPWAFWMSQWQRDDPIQKLLEGGYVAWSKEAAVLECVDNLNELLPDASEVKLRAATEMRLRRQRALLKIFDLDESASAMCGILSSRAIELGDNIVGVLPMFDMINHSNDPNLSLTFDGGNFELFANRAIDKDEELFVRYTRVDDTNSGKSVWDENEAIWNLVQWGIPENRPKTEQNMSMVDEFIPVLET